MEKRNLLIEQIESSIEFLSHRIAVESRNAERSKLERELAKAKGSLSLAHLAAEAAKEGV